MSILNPAIIKHELPGMKPDHPAPLTAGANAMLFKAGDVMFRVGYSARRFYEIERGRIARGTRYE